MGDESSLLSRNFAYVTSAGIRAFLTCSSQIYMREMIEERRQSASDGADRQADLFTNLVSGTSLDATEKTVDQLSDEELMGKSLLLV